MTTYWSGYLLTPKLGDVAFQISARKVGGGRRRASYQFPYRDGQGIEDTGRAPTTFDLTIPLFRSMATKETADAIYPGTLDRILALIEDDASRGEVEYIDTEFGPYDVKIVGFSWDTAGERQDGGTLTLQLEERGFDQSLLQNLSTDARLSARAKATRLAVDVDYKFESLLAEADNTKYLKPVTDDLSLANAWSKFQDALDQGAMALDEYAAQIDSVTFLAEKIMAFDVLDEIQRFSLVNSCLDFIGAARDVGNTAADQPGAKLVEFILPGPMSMYEIAQSRYGSSERAEEISSNNPTSNPMLYRQGERVMVYDR